MKRALLFGLMVLAALATALPVSAQVFSDLRLYPCYAADTGAFQVTVFNAGNRAGQFGFTLEPVLLHDYARGDVFDLGWLDPGEVRSVTLPLRYAGTWYVLEKLALLWRFDGVTALMYTNLVPACTGHPTAQSIPQSVPLAPPCAAGDPSGLMVTFTDETELLWAADADAHTGVYVSAGQTAKVIEQQGGYTGIVWACSPLWIVSGDGEMTR